MHFGEIKRAAGGQRKREEEKVRVTERTGDTKWLNDSVRLLLFVDLNHANPFVIPQTVAAAREQIRRSPRRLVKSIPQERISPEIHSYPPGTNHLGYCTTELASTVTRYTRDLARRRRHLSALCYERTRDPRVTSIPEEMRAFGIKDGYHVL